MDNGIDCEEIVNKTLIANQSGDVPVLLIAAAVFAFLTPRGKVRTTTQR